MRWDPDGDDAVAEHSESIVKHVGPVGKALLTAKFEDGVLSYYEHPYPRFVARCTKHYRCILSRTAQRHTGKPESGRPVGTFACFSGTRAVL